MTKKKFFDYCDKSEAELDIYCCKEFFTNNKIIFLHGSWSDNTIINVELYRKQARDYYKSSIACEQMMTRYKKWLGEWNVKNRI